MLSCPNFTNLGIYADTRNKLTASSFDDEYKPKNRSRTETRNITHPQSSVDQILLSKVLFQTDKFPQKTKAKFPNDEPWLSFSQMNHKCTAENNQDILVMDDTGFVSVGMTLRADQSDKIYHVKDILDENKLRLSTNVEKSINDEILHFNEGKFRRKHAILRFLDLATHVSLTADHVNEDELSSFLDAYDNARWLKGRKQDSYHLCIRLLLESEEKVIVGFKTEVHKNTRWIVRYRCYHGQARWHDRITPYF